ncbi:DUF1294 domain-containing protein [Novosphingobium bradum]|uniref:DUF1294 domain-containing protein n=1 Tax=Novosphingobium bradum TaxID=1737444 RepID=A0ABV7IQC4_9SPHN
MPSDPASLVALALLALNLITLALFGLDKALARASRRRIPEARLLGLALLGGTPGAYAGRALFRHKTRKQPFSRQLGGIAAMQVLVAGAALGWWLGG